MPGRAEDKEEVMDKELLVITAATGNIGRKVVEILLGRGRKVRAVARNEKNLEPLAKMGAEIFPGDVEDPAAVRKAFSGAQAVFTLIPPKYSSENFRAYQNKVAENYAQAIESSQIGHVVNLSSVGAHLADKNGPIGGLHDAEKRISRIAGINVVHLRPAFFMENHFFTLGLIKEKGINGSALKGDMPIPQIATKDIAQAAAELLARLDFKGVSARELLGTRDVSMAEATRHLGKAIGKPELPFVQFSYEDTRKALEGMGFSADASRLFVEMYEGFNSGVVRPAEARSAGNTTPTRIEDFAAEFAQVYNAN